MAFPYKKAVVIGATSGIGLELAQRLVGQGVSVIAVGRRQQRLDSFVASAGPGKAYGYQFDLAKIEEIPSFVKRITEAHPDLDSVFLNAGVQYVMDFSKAWTVDISKIQHEITVNYISMVSLTHSFIPFFQSKPSGSKSALIYTTTSLMSVPYPMVLNYCASKAALHSFILSVREQLKFAKTPEGKINLIELVTPLVQTELHDGQQNWGPDFNPGMPVSEFVEAALQGFAAGDETVAVGHAKGVFDEFEEVKGKRVGPAWEMVRKNMGKAHLFD